MRTARALTVFGEWVGVDVEKKCQKKRIFLGGYLVRGGGVLSPMGVYLVLGGEVYLVPGGVLSPGGCLPVGVSAQGGVCLGGVSARGGVPAQLLPLL